MLYLDAPQNFQRSFLYKTKNTLGYTWNQFAQFLNVHRQMMYFYANETSCLPLQHYIRICRKTSQQPKPLPTVFISNKLKEVYLPSLNEDLAELLGIIAGDGYLGKDAFELTITLDKNADKDYVPYVSQLIQTIFKTRPAIYHQKNVTRVKVYSKQLFIHLRDQHSTPTGNKKNVHTISAPIWTRKIYLAAFIRGLFDTDGSFHRHRPTDAAVEITSLDDRFLQQTVDALNFLGIRATRSSKNAYVYSKKHIHRFFMKVGTSNPKNKLKYEHFCKHGTVPIAFDRR